MALFAALIGPHFIDWTSYRDSFEREASAYVGRPVTVAGKVAVRLLPTPVVSFTDIYVGDAEEPDLRMERFRAEIGLTPLLSGEIRVIQMTMERPVFRLDLGRIESGDGIFASARVPDPEHVALERLEIVDGSALVSDARTARAWHADNIDAVVEADTLLGPARGEAALVLDGRPLNVTVGIGRFADGTAAAKLTLRSPDAPATLAADGRLVFAAGAPPRYEGTATVAGIEPAEEGAPRSPWADFRANGGFSLTPSELALDKVQLSYGAIERPLILEASGALAFAAEPRFDLTLAARQIDLDRSLGGSADTPVAIEAAIPALAAMLPRIPLPSIAGRLRFEAQGIVIGGGVVQGVGVDLSTGEDAWNVDGLTAVLPGETEVSLSGALGVRPQVTFRGKGRVASARPAAFAAWWRGEAGLAARMGRFALQSDIDIAADGQRFQNLVATTGTGTMRGTIDVRRFPQSGRYFVDVDLGADHADLVESQALAELFAAKLAADSLDQMTLSLHADALSAGGIEAHRVAVEGGIENGHLNLRRLSVADLAGASIDALGSISDPLGTPAGTMEASVHAEDFSGAAEFLANLAPESRIAGHLRDVAPILSPVVAELSVKAGEPGEQLALSLTGSFGATHLSLDAQGAGRLDDPKSLSGTVKLHADGEDSGTVLRQLGLAALPVRSPPLDLDADFAGKLAEGGRLTLAGTVAGVALSYEGTTSLADGQPAATGTFKLDGDDIDPVLLLAGIAVPGIGEGHAASASGRIDYASRTAHAAIEEGHFAAVPVKGALEAAFGNELRLSGSLDLGSVSLPVLAGLATGTMPAAAPGKWNDAPFAAPLPGNVALDLTLAAAELDLGLPQAASDAKLDLQLAGGGLQIDLQSAALAGGTLKGALGLQLSGGEAELTLRGALEHGALQALVWEHSGLPVASGSVDISVDLTGRGRSTAGVVATLAGSGAFTVTDGRIDAMNPEALSVIMQAAEGEREPDEAEARGTFASLFASGTVDIGGANGSFSVADGVVTVPTVSLQSGDTAMLADAVFDLNRRTLRSGWVVRRAAGPDEAQPTVEVSFSGPIADPVRTVDIEPLLTLMRSRFVQRQLERIEELETARRKAEAEEQARKAEEERRAEEARRSAGEPPGDQPATGAPADPASPNPAPPNPALLSPPDPLAAEPQQSAPRPLSPLELVPLPELERPTQAAPDPMPPPAPPVRRRAEPTPQRSIVAPPVSAPPPPPLPEYKTLPNGTIVKIR